MGFFQGFVAVFNHFFDVLQVFVDGRCSRFAFSRHELRWSRFRRRRRFGSDHGFYCRGSSGTFGSFLGQAFFFTLATTHFTRIVRSATVAGQGAGRSRLDNRCSDFSHDWGNHRSRLWLCNHGRLFSRHGFNHGGLRCFDGWLGPLERGLDFLSRLWRRFRNRSFDDRGLGNWFFNDWRCDNRCFDNRGFDGRFRRHEYWQFSGNRWLDRGVSDRLDVTNRIDFHFRYRWRFHRGGCLNDRCFNRWSFLGRGSGQFGLLMRLGFGWSTDHAAGDGGGHGQAGSQFGTGGWFVVFFAAFFRAFDHIAVGITLTLATVAATTLATGAVVFS